MGILKRVRIAIFSEYWRENMKFMHMKQRIWGGNAEFFVSLLCRANIKCTCENMKNPFLYT